jgi:hypothetical protein
MSDSRSQTGSCRDSVIAVACVNSVLARNKRNYNQHINAPGILSRKSNQVAVPPWGGSRLHLGLQPQPASEKRPQPQPAKPAAFEIQPTVQKSASRMPFGRNSSGNLFTTDPGATFLSSGSDARDNSVRGRGRIATPRASSHRGVLNIRQFQMSKILFL